MASHGWGASNWPSLKALWNGESGWNPAAYNASSGATGIPQALPGSKMASAGGDWRTNGDTQIRWGEGYIASVYGNPTNAYSKWLSRDPHWYARGTNSAAPGYAVVGERGPELVKMHGGEQVIPHYATGGKVIKKVNPGAAIGTTYTTDIPVSLLDKYNTIERGLTNTSTAMQNAAQALSTAIQTQSSYRSQTASAANTFGSIVNSGSDATSIQATLKGKLADMQQFDANLKQLAKDGIDPTTYQQLVDAGVDGGGLATSQAMLDGGLTQIKQISHLEKQIHQTSGDLGTSAANHLYGPATKAARAQVRSLTDKHGNLSKESKDVLAEIVSTVGREFNKDHNLTAKQIAAAVKEAMSNATWTGTIDDKGLKVRMDSQINKYLKTAANKV